MLIVVAILFFDSHVIPPFPNGYTLVPIVGTLLIIRFGTNGTFVGWLLATRPLRWIGLVSYSAYLWHQPVLVFLRMRFDEEPHILTSLIIINFVLFLAILSYFFVEQPFRNKQRFSRKQTFCTALTTTLVLFVIGLLLIGVAKNRSLSTSEQSDSYVSDLGKVDNARYVGRVFDALARKRNTYENRSLNTSRKIILIGDSFAQDFYNMIIENQYLMNDEIRVHLIHAHCQVYMELENRLYYVLGKSKQKCIPASDISYALPLIRQANIIFLAANWDDGSAAKLPYTLKLLNAEREQQMFVIGAKNFGKINVNLYVNKSKDYRIKQRQYPDLNAVKVNTLLEKTINQSMFVNVQKLICHGFNDTCPLFTPDGKLISLDGKHLTKYGARHVGSIIFNNKPLNTLLITDHLRKSLV